MLPTQWSPDLFIQLLLDNTIRIFKMHLRTNCCFLYPKFVLPPVFITIKFSTIHLAAHSKTQKLPFIPFLYSFPISNPTVVLSTTPSNYTPMCPFLTTSITDTLVQTNIVSQLDHKTTSELVSLTLYSPFHNPFCTQKCSIFF